MGHRQRCGTRAGDDCGVGDLVGGQGYAVQEADCEV